MNGLLPSFMKFKSAKDLVRVGKENDGGYLVSRSDVEASDALLGLGISNDWSFERDFYKLRMVPVIAFDGSISERIFRKKLVKAFLRFYQIKRLMESIKTYFSYKRFFSSDDRRHVKKFIGINRKNNLDNHNWCSLDDVLSGINFSDIFLKIDIEGSEYRILNSLIKNRKRFTGIVVEFHDCDIHLDKISYFISNINMKLVHIHANNFASITESDLCPTVLELTFSTHAETEDNNIMPHDFDMPNNKLMDEVMLSIRS